MTLYSAANLAAFSGACPLFAALLRGGANPNKSVPAQPKRDFRNRIYCCRKMKEYDA
jgi:hypothetical protein